MVRICTGEVCVRSRSREPSGFGLKKNVSCISRAGWPSGMLSFVKLRSSVSMSGPSATARPMSAKIAVSSSITWLIGWMRPTSAGVSRSGSVTSRRSVLRRASSVAFLSASRRAVSASVTRSLRPLISGPLDLRSSGVIAPSVRSSAETEPLLPSAATRTASSAASSEAPAISLRICGSSVAMSDMAVLDGFVGPSIVTPGLVPGIHVFLANQTKDVDGRDRPGHDGEGMVGRNCLGGSRRQSGLGLFDDRLKGRRLVDGEVGQDLAIDHEPGLGEAVDKSAVVEPKRPHRGIEALDPERPEGALAAFAVAEGVLIGLLDRLLGNADRVLATAVIAFRGLEDFLVLGVSGDTTLDAGHG